MKSIDTYPPIDPLSKSSLSYMTQGRRNAMWPDEFVNIETLVSLYLIFTRNLVIHNKHLLNDRLSNHLLNNGKGYCNLTYISNLEHLLVVQSFLGFKNAR